MWRSNVLRLRKCSSTAINRNGLNIRWYSSGKSLPVAEREFEVALREVLPWIWNTESKTPLGFAISGGVDSMALAALYARAQQSNKMLPQAHGFIVDHKVRPESTEEAAWVAEQLRSKFAMESSILTINWPENVEMRNHVRFEATARTFRYQALGRACRERKIQAMMLAHHADDQAETVLMRLANKRLRTGLKGMLPAEWIPECDGIYGVHHSGKKQRADPSLNIPFPVEQGGIRILRPLLAIEKARLIATCEEQGVQWAEDKSNHDRTLTGRNAIRHIYMNHKLPEALGVQSLVDVSLYMQKRISECRSYAAWLYDECLMKLDIQTGSLLVRFPPFASLLERPIVTQRDKIEARDNAYCLIEKVAELVTAKPKTALGQLAARIDSIYPEFLTTEEREELVAANEAHFRDNFTVSHVWWRKWEKPSPFEDSGIPSEDFGSSAPHPKEWLLTRQTLGDGEAKKSQLVVHPSQTQISSLDAIGTPEPIETFQLFDGRFWIKLVNHTHDNLIVRTFQKEDMVHLPSTQVTKGVTLKNTGVIPDRFITAAFALLKPSDLRFTLPTVFRIDSSTGQESLLGFPTLNVRMDGFGAPEGVCDWSVRYKKLDFGTRSAGDIVVPGMPISDIMEQEKRQRLANKGIEKLKIRKNRVVTTPRLDPIIGYKRVNHMTKQARKQQSNYTQRAMGGEETDGLSFLEEDSGQEFEHGLEQKKSQTPGRR
ncbi:PP-loop family-domain-containing protein [Paraphoma chrysanthemicola]|uniref:tRNA(Ile)-lysidine synthetase n=1 Tax=Paraphoma chrysanthemicola TaxID=798071 RepID=A0A8K0RMB2_9PLEO|nr:PP-loop family-domain-containing protein [Paraphoma chrysanthemicola]